MGWKAKIIELSREYGLSDKEVAQIIFHDYGKLVSDDTVRYYARRKGNLGKTKSEMSNSGIEKILVINDLHIPFHREQDIIDIILKHRNEITMIVFAGDILDCQAISKFPKSYLFPIEEEMIIASKFLKRIDNLTKGIKKVLIKGNHEERFPAYIIREGGQVGKFINNDIIETILHGYTVYDERNKVKKKVQPLPPSFTYIKNWYWQYKDIIFAHPLSFSNIPARTVCNAIEKFVKEGMIFNVVVIGHTHKYGDIEHFGKWGIENNCLCLRHDYALKGNLKMTPQSYGYTILTLRNGITDRNESKVLKLFPKEGDEVWQEVVVD